MFSSKLKEEAGTMITSAGSNVAQKVTWQIDPSHSLVEFSVKHMVVTTVKGRFTNVTGMIVEDMADITQSAVEVEIDAVSINTHDEQRDNHLRSADFFDAANHPTLTFKSKRVEIISGDEIRVIGDLTIRGSSHEVVLNTTINGQAKTPFGTEIAGFTAETSINRKDFGLNWNVALETGGFLVSDKIKITLEIEAVKQ